MDNNITKNAYYYLRSLPLFAAALVYFFLMRIHPEFVKNLNTYLVVSNPEEQFSQYGWSLYYIIIPFCIAALSRAQRHWPMIIVLFIYPIALSLSYWLWELLGWAVMFFCLCGVAGAPHIDGVDDKAHDILVGLSLVVSILYAILRILGGFGATHLLGLADIGLVVLIGGYFVICAIIDVFRFEEGYDTIVHPAGITLLYLFVLSVALLLMSGDSSWGTATLSGADRQKYNNLVLRAEESQRAEHYRYAAYYYTQAARIRQDKKNTQLAETMNLKADSVTDALMRSIPQDLNALRKEKRKSATFEEHANAIEQSIKKLEANISSSATSSVVVDYKKRLETQRKRKK